MVGMVSGMCDWHGHFLVMIIKVQGYKCLALSKGFKRNIMMTYGVMVEAKTLWI
jgi:hypothetical protein